MWAGAVAALHAKCCFEGVSQCHNCASAIAIVSIRTSHVSRSGDSRSYDQRRRLCRCDLVCARRHASCFRLLRCLPVDANQALSEACLQPTFIHARCIQKWSTSTSLFGCRELDTGTQLASFKQCSAAVNGLAVLGTDYFIAAQQQKDAIHVYSWFKVRNPDPTRQPVGCPAL